MEKKSRKGRSIFDVNLKYYRDGLERIQRRYWHSYLPTDFVHKNWSSTFIHWLEEIQVERASGNFVLKVHLHELEHLRRIITALNRNIRVLSRTVEYKANVQLLKIIPITRQTCELCRSYPQHRLQWRNRDHKRHYQPTKSIFAGLDRWVFVDCGTKGSGTTDGLSTLH